MIYHIGNVGLSYDIKCNDVNAIEQAVRRARVKYENGEYTDFFSKYFEDELDELGITYGAPREYTIKW